KLVENLEFYKKVKYRNIKYYFTRDTIINKQVYLYYINTKVNIVDILTKPLGKALFNNI
ncbi:uncharacterized protein LY79DRAFT_470963, partial [Colletotrichum navitas]